MCLTKPEPDAQTEEICYKPTSVVWMHLGKMGGGAKVVCLLEQLIQALSGPFGLHQNWNSLLPGCLCQQNSTVCQAPIKVGKACVLQNCINGVWLKILQSVLDTRCQNGRPGAPCMSDIQIFVLHQGLKHVNSCAGCHCPLACCVTLHL